MFSLKDRDACAERGLPVPKKYQTQLSYVTYCLLEGYSINTRDARYIGIANLNSVAPKLAKKGIPFTNTKEKVWDPKENRIDPKKVIVLRMSTEQREEYWANKKPAKA
jgi:hypothetical protein